MTEPSAQDHVKWLASLVKDKRGEYDKIQAQIAQLEDRADEIRRELEDLNGALNLVRRSQGMETPDFRPFEFRAMTVANAAFLVLSRRGGTMKVVDMLRLLQEGGKQFKSEKATSVVQTALDRDPRFRRVRPGIYKLTDEGPPNAGAGKEVAAGTEA